MNRKLLRAGIEVLAVLATVVIFLVPFSYVILTSLKTPGEASQMNLSLPAKALFLENYGEVLRAQNGMVLRAFWNSTMITALSIAGLILVCSMAGYVLERRSSRVSSLLNFLVLVGLMIPPSVVTTIWVLKGVYLYKTIPGIVLIEIALSFPFSAILYRGFMVSVPKELDEAALIDGCDGWRLFARIVFPLLKPVTATVIVLSAVGIFNDFTNPLYFLPGAKNATVQLTLYNFMSMYVTKWNLLFADVVLISLPPLALFIFFNRQIVSGMTAGSIKG
jgi:raffinose/stachyose/melibiose transport system permease protein